jgi:pimeloyl-ACP methyl ester carboxylesterase
MAFQTGLTKKSFPITINFDPQQHVLLLLFGGLAQQIGMPFFEFNKITSGLSRVNKIFLRDKYRSWYHRGLPRMGRDIDAVASFLQQYTAHASTHKIIAVGNSGGGYAALLFGALLGVDEVHAFSPKTFIDPIKRIINNDIPPKYGARHLLRLYLHGKRKYFDLKKVFLASASQKGNYHIYYAENNKKDHLHASHVKSISGIHLHSFQYDRHNLVMFLKQSNRLREIIQAAISFSD